MPNRTAIRTEKFLTKELDDLIKKVMDCPTPEEHTLSCILAIMDETLQLFEKTEYKEVIWQTYYEIEEYIKQKDQGQ